MQLENPVLPGLPRRPPAGAPAGGAAMARVAISATDAIRRLDAALSQAKRIYDTSADGGREAAIVALGGVCELIDSVDGFRARGLALPLSMLGVGLRDLDTGAVVPMLQPRKLSHPAPDTWDRRTIIGAAAATAEAL